MEEEFKKQSMMLSLDAQGDKRAFFCLLVAPRGEYDHLYRTAFLPVRGVLIGVRDRHDASRVRVCIRIGDDQDKRRRHVDKCVVKIALIKRDASIAQAEADLEKANENGFTPLLAAADKGYLDVARVLREAW